MDKMLTDLLSILTLKTSKSYPTKTWLKFLMSKGIDNIIITNNHQKIQKIRF